MSNPGIFSMQEVFCQTCGSTFETNFNGMGGYGRNAQTCSKRCWDELEWKKHLSAMGEPYRSSEVKP